MIAAAQGLRVVALDVEPTRLELAKEFGAAATINPLEMDAAAGVRDLTGGKGAELSLETSGSSAAGRSALDCLAVWGRACFVGLGTHVHFDVEGFLDRQITAMTSWSMSSVGQRQLADFAIKRNLNFDRLFTSRWSFDQAAEAYQAFDKQSGGKGVFIS
ncbi:zinc-binding dehydrogenase [Mesorhizobium sp. ORM8.1]